MSVSVRGLNRGASNGGTYLESEQKCRHQFVHLQQANVLPDASSGPCTECENRIVHDSFLLGRRVDPPSRAVQLGLFPEKRVSVYRPSVTAHDGPGGDELAADGHPAGGHDPLQRQACRWVTPEGLLDDGVEVRQVSHVVPGQQPFLAGGHFFQFLRQLLHVARVSQEVVENGTEGDGRRVGPGEHVGHRHRQHPVVRHELGVFAMGFVES